MSYILDALKKSEQQRGHGKIPDVQTIHSSSLNYGNGKKTYWPYILIIAVVLNLIAIVYFIFDKNDNTKSIMSVHTSTNKTETITPTPESKIAIKTAPDKAVIEPSKPEIKPSAIIEKNSTKQNEVTAAEPVLKDKPYAPPHQQKSNEVVDFYNLPDATQKRVPVINISAHIYSSNPIQRSIVINNKFLEEGDYIIDDLVLNEITPDGAIFEFEGSRFNYNVVSGWQ